MVLAVGISILSCLQAEIYVDDGLAAAILYFSLPVTCRSIQSYTIGKPDLDNMVLAVEILILSCLQAQIHLILIQLPHLTYLLLNNVLALYK